MGAGEPVIIHTSVMAAQFSLLGDIIAGVVSGACVTLGGDQDSGGVAISRYLANTLLSMSAGFCRSHNPRSIPSLTR